MSKYELIIKLIKIFLYNVFIYRNRIQLLWATWLYNRQRMLLEYVIDFYHICILYSSEHISSAKQWHVHYFLSTYRCFVIYIPFSYIPHYTNNIYMIGSSMINRLITLTRNFFGEMRL